ncbi:hypothetical protein IE4872_CH00490 [Rhizobium gallicum]|uniref:Uncharacterized protein n=1 Tax=Rhizobium gallicum TaxID=56730 RepID=A0A1L5NE36_9HYPH|nr:hypothetical protein [Rhizobium gallicum]APO66155.1 hypothetical protein IE4872_CH00490 [Rhizobium gallicum]
MKLDQFMRFPHPVLSEYSSDYVTGEFKCSFQQNITAGGELRLESDFQITNPDLADLVKNQKAATGYFLICRRTYFNTLQEAPTGKAEKFFDMSQLFGTVNIRPVVWTLEKIEGYSSPLFDDEYGDAVTIMKGAVIAIGPDFQFSIDQKKYKPFETIFRLEEEASVAPGTISVDADQDYIIISAEGATYKSIAQMRDMKLGPNLLLNAVYMPAVMDVICRLQVQPGGFEGRKWFRVFKAKCDDLAIDPSDQSVSALELSQKLLRAPLNRTISMMESFG